MTSSRESPVCRRPDGTRQDGASWLLAPAPSDPHTLPIHFVNLGLSADHESLYVEQHLRLFVRRQLSETLQWPIRSIALPAASSWSCSLLHHPLITPSRSYLSPHTAFPACIFTMISPYSTSSIA